MANETTFRTTLISQLTSLVTSQELDKRFVRAIYIEDKQDVLGEFLDYYTDELLAYERFEEHFTPQEIDAIRDFMLCVRSAMREVLGWREIVTQATSLLAMLRDHVVPTRNKDAGAQGHRLQNG